MRADQHAATVVVDGTPLGVFDTVEGGAVDSEEAKYRPGGMGPQQSLGGFVSVDNVTVGRLYELGRDHDLVRWLTNRAGKARVTVVDQFLDTDGNPFGKPYIYTGTLKTVNKPPADSNSSDASVWTIVVSTEGTVG